MKSRWHSLARLVATLLVVVFASWHAAPSRSIAVGPPSATQLLVASTGATSPGDARDAASDERSNAESESESESESEEERSDEIEALVLAAALHDWPTDGRSFDPWVDRAPVQPHSESVSPPPEA